MEHLRQLLTEAALKFPERPAVLFEGRHQTYRELSLSTSLMKSRLSSCGLKAGDRVVLCLPKSPDYLALIYAAIDLGIIYVPVDSSNPPERVLKMADLSGAALLITGQTWSEQSENSQNCLRKRVSTVDLNTFLDQEKEILCFPTHSNENEQATRSVACILFTSGTTGTQKGVALTHGNILAFITWAFDLINPGETDRFASHAGFHFDLSMLDLFVPCLSGGCVCLIPETLGMIGSRLAEFVMRHHISVWYSVPTAILSMLPGNNQVSQYPGPRVVCFAGEEFPRKRLSELRNFWPGSRLINMYGPTETNVCTFHEVTGEDIQSDTPLPVGKASCGNKVFLSPLDGGRDDQGEITVEGPTVMAGYWGEPEQTGPYRTGDLGTYDDKGCLLFLGRINQDFVKHKGRRFSTREIEQVLMSHREISNAVVLLGDRKGRISLDAWYEGKKDLSLMSIKKFCAGYLPGYMIIERMQWTGKLPVGQNGKIAREKLRTQLG